MLPRTKMAVVCRRQPIGGASSSPRACASRIGGLHRCGVFFPFLDGDLRTVAFLLCPVAIDEACGEAAAKRKKAPSATASSKNSCVPPAPRPSHLSSTGKTTAISSTSLTGSSHRPFRIAPEPCEKLVTGNTMRKQGCCRTTWLGIMTLAGARLGPHFMDLLDHRHLACATKTCIHGGK